MNKTFKWGVIGTGGIANAFANDLKYIENHIVESVLSRNLETAKIFSSNHNRCKGCLLYTSPSPRDVEESRMPSSA